MQEHAIEGTHTGALNALCDLVVKCEKAVADGRITAEQSRKLTAEVGDMVLPKELPSLKDASGDQFLAIYETVLEVMRVLEESPEDVGWLLDEETTR